MQNTPLVDRTGWFLVATTVAAFGLLVRWLLDPILGESMPHSIAIIFGVLLSRYSGFWPGLVAVLLGLATSRFLFVEPRGVFSSMDVADLVAMGIPTSGGLVIAWLMDQLRLSQERAERQSQALLEKQRDYEQELIERRRVESHLLATKADLRLGQEEFRTLAEKSPVGIFRTDQTGACTFVNEYWCRLAGISAEETMGTGWARVIHPDDLQEFGRRWQESLREQRPFVGGYRICRPDGEICTAITAAQPVFDEQGRLAHYVGMVMDMTEQKDAFDALARKQKLLRSLIEAQEREKSMLCHEFHDGLIQYAVASLMVLESCRHGGRESLSPEVSEAIDNVTRFLSVGIEDGRRVIRGIRTAVLDDLGLEAAIDDLVDQFETGGIACETSIDLGADALPASLQTTIYRIVQESLSNVRRHSGATRAIVRVSRIDDDVQVSIHDDGCGFDRAGVRPRGFGLIGIEERTMLAGGECRIESAPGRGTTVSLQLPVPHDAAAGDPALEAAASD